MGGLNNLHKGGSDGGCSSWQDESVDGNLK